MILVVLGFVGCLFGLYLIELIIIVGLCNNLMGGIGNVVVLFVVNWMEFIVFV